MPPRHEALNGYDSFAIFARHGQTELNKRNRPLPFEKQMLTGRTDTPLTPKGIDQAAEAGRVLEAVLREYGLTLRAVVSSPSPRAVHTAEIMAAQLSRNGFARRTHEGVHERSMGVLEGRTVEEVMQAHGWDAAYVDRLRQSFDLRPEGGEHYGDVTGRLVHAVGETRHEYLTGLSPAEAELIVCHKGPLRVSHFAFGGKSAQEILHLDIPNAELSVFGFHRGEVVLPHHVPTADRSVRLHAGEAVHA